MFFLTRARAMGSRDEWSREFDINIKSDSGMVSEWCLLVLTFSYVCALDAAAAAAAATAGVIL